MTITTIKYLHAVDEVLAEGAGELLGHGHGLEGIPVLGLLAPEQRPAVPPEVVALLARLEAFFRRLGEGHAHRLEQHVQLVALQGRTHGEG